VILPTEEEENNECVYWFSISSPPSLCNKYVRSYVYVCVQRYFCSPSKKGKNKKMYTPFIIMETKKKRLVFCIVIIKKNLHRIANKNVCDFYLLNKTVGLGRGKRIKTLFPKFVQSFISVLAPASIGLGACPVCCTSLRPWPVSSWILFSLFHIFSFFL
jgi:hypothetical protein